MSTSINNCMFLGPIKSTRKIGDDKIDVHHCRLFDKSCTVEPNSIMTPEGLMRSCGGCTEYKHFQSTVTQAPATSGSAEPKVTPKLKLTVGMPTFRDWTGVWATIQHIRLCHQECLNEIEIVVVDNDPDGKPDVADGNHSWKVKSLCARVGATYEHYTDVIGTAAAKGRIFELAKAPAVLVMDCHVLLPTMVLKRLVQWFDDHMNKDFYQGPCIGDGGTEDIVGTHFEPKWGSLMYGVWAVDKRVHFTEDQFEIPMQGCGLFACRKDAWPGFHPKLRGFGPEEWHIHQRVRRNGGFVWCLPWLKWCHRFGNPDGAKVPGLHPEERLRGHLITFLDTGSPSVEEIRHHFVDEAKAVTQDRFYAVLGATRDELGHENITGLGDMVESVLNATGIGPAVKAVAKAAGVKDCGCNKRRERLNRAVPLKQADE